MFLFNNIKTMEYKEQLMSIIDKVREDFSVLGQFAFMGTGDINQVNDCFWRAYDAALEAEPLVNEQMKKSGNGMTGIVDWNAIEGFRIVVQQAGFPVMMANSQLYGQYTMQLNQFFIMAQGL